MSSNNKIFDDMSRVFSGAMGVAQGAKTEAETAMKNWFEGFVAEKGYVKRDEFEAVAEMAQNARTEVAALRDEIEAMKAATKPARKSPTKSSGKAAKK